MREDFFLAGVVASLEFVPQGQLASGNTRIGAETEFVERAFDRQGSAGLSLSLFMKMPDAFGHRGPP
jgi:hypothetical protein